MDGTTSRQDGEQFEECLRRCNALERKLTQQVQLDISQLRQKWVQHRVDRVTNNTFKLYQVREQLKLSKLLYVEEEQILDEFTKVKQCLATNHMDDDTFEAARETCLVLGGKLGGIRRKQDRCYADTKDLEMVIDKDIVACNYEEKDLSQLDLTEVRGRTPVRQISPTPLDRHRSRSREPAEFHLPGTKLSQMVSGRRSATPDPHAYFSRPGSSLSVYGGRGGDEASADPFRAAMEAKQEEDEPLVLRSHTGDILIKSDESKELFDDRPVSAMSDMSIEGGGGVTSRPGSRLEMRGDVVSEGRDNNVAQSVKPSLGDKRDEKKNVEVFGLSNGDSTVVSNSKFDNMKTSESADDQGKESKIIRKMTITAKETTTKSEPLKDVNISKVNVKKEEKISEPKQENTASTKQVFTEKSSATQQKADSNKSCEIENKTSLNKSVNAKTNPSSQEKAINNGEKVGKKMKIDEVVEKSTNKGKPKTLNVKKKQDEKQKENCQSERPSITSNSTDTKIVADDKPVDDKSSINLKTEESAETVSDAKSDNNFPKRESTSSSKSQTTTTMTDSKLPQNTSAKSKSISAEIGKEDPIPDTVPKVPFKSNKKSKLETNAKRIDTLDAKEVSKPESEPVAPLIEAKEIFAMIAKESSKSNIASEKVEPAELVFDENNEDEIMIILDDHESTDILMEEKSDQTENFTSENDLRPKSTGYRHLDDFEMRLEMMTKELEVENDEAQELPKEPEFSYNVIKDEITGSQIRRINNQNGVHVNHQDVSTDVLPKLQSEVQRPAPVAPPRMRSRSRTREPTPSSFLSAMTGGLVESQKFGSITQLVRGRSRSRSRMSRQSSTERSATDLLPDIAAEAVNKLISITKKKRVEQVDFDELFARGLAMSADQEKDKNLTENEFAMITFKQETGINFGDGGDDSEVKEERGRRRQRNKKPPAPEGENVDNNNKAIVDRNKSKDTSRARTRSREYAKPQEIRLSPIVKRDLFTGKLLDGSTEEEVFLKKVTSFITKNQETLNNLDVSNTLKAPQLSINYSKSPVPQTKSDEIKPSPGKSFLDCDTGQELFNKSIEEADGETLYPLEYKKNENLGDPADKNIPKILKPDSLLKNEEFYENLRSGLKNLAAQNHASGQENKVNTNYSHHLGRAEFGTLKRKENIPRATISRDSSGEKIKQQINSRDNSGDRFKVDESRSRQARSSSRVSDYSSALPDLEVETDIIINEQVEKDEPVMLKTKSVDEIPQQPDVPIPTIVEKKEVAMKEIDERRQIVSDTKAWIQNSLMTVVGVGVLAYLQTLESSM